MSPQEIRQVAERLRAQAEAVFIRGEAGYKIAVASDVTEWYTAQLQLLADQQTKAAASDIYDLDEMLMARHLSPRAETETLRQAIDRIINWEVGVNLDPAVSSAAQELVERGRQEAMTQAALDVRVGARIWGPQADAGDAVDAAVRREADAWRAVVEVERQRAAVVEERYWELVKRLSSLSMASMPGPRVVADASAECSGLYLYTRSAASQMAVDARREAFKEAAEFLRQWGVSGAPVDAIERKAAEMDR